MSEQKAFHSQGQVLLEKKQSKILQSKAKPQLLIALTQFSSV
jgi:hypothetical protein